MLECSAHGRDVRVRCGSRGRRIQKDTGVMCTGRTV